MCLIGKQNKPTLFKVTEPSSLPYRTPPACAKWAAYPDPPPLILLPESIAAQIQPPQVTVSWRSKTEMTEFRTWVGGSGPKCFQVLGLSPNLPQDRML